MKQQVTQSTQSINKVRPASGFYQHANINTIPDTERSSTVELPMPDTCSMSRFSHDFCRVPIRSIAPTIQPKLTIGQSNDPYEQEADRGSEQVMRMPEPCGQCQGQSEEDETLQTKPLSAQITPLVQRQVEPEEEEEKEAIQAKLTGDGQIQRQVEEPEEEDKEESLQPKRNNEQMTQMKPGIETQIRALHGGGQPLPESVRSFFEPRFGHDFSHVRVHTDRQAAETAQAVKARAYTVGRDVVFGSGQYAPDTNRGRRLLAHELTHVVQQGHSVRAARLPSQINSQNNNGKRRVDRRVANFMHGAERYIELSHHVPVLQRRECPPPERLGRVAPPEMCATADPNTRVPDQFRLPLRFCYDSDNLIDSDAGNVGSLRSQLHSLTLGTARGVQIHGYSSLPGGMAYNRRLACHRAIAVKRMLGLGTANPISLHSHGATSVFGAQAENQRVVVVLGPAPPAPPRIPAPSCRRCPRANPSCLPGYCSPMPRVLARASRRIAGPVIVGELTRRGGGEVGAIYSQFVWGGRSGVMPLSSSLRNEFATICQTAVATNHIMTAIVNAIWGRYPASTVAQTIPLNTIAPTAIRDIGTPLNAHELVYCGANNAPGLLAGGIGTTQLSSPVGAIPSTQNDSRTATGQIDVSRHTLPGGGSRVVFTPTINIEVRDTVDFCPGNCGDWKAQLATVPLSRWEASRISGDVAFVTRFAAPRSQLRKIVLETVNGVDRWSLESM